MKAAADINQGHAEKNPSEGYRGERETGTKAEIRRRILKVRDALTQEERKRAALLMTERILGHQWYYLSDTVLCYAGCGSEISTDELIREALSGGKKVYLPKVEGENMNFYRIESPAELVKGYKGIPEPKGDTEKYHYRERGTEKTLLLMPGVAYDGCRNRIGYGKGFYDRFLADKPDLQLRSIALGYQCQLLERLPAEETDIRPYQVICV